MSELPVTVADSPATATPDRARSLRSGRATRSAILVAIVALAAVVRLYRLDELPPGLFIDQAQYGLDAYRISQGETFPVFVEGPGGIKARGREPLFMYLMAGVFLLLGPTPATIKLTSALIGIATVAVTYFAASHWLGSRSGLLAAGLLAVSRWHVTFSRMGFRAILTPLWVSLVVLALGILLRRRSRAAAAGFGAVLGAGFYTYPAYWSVPPALALILAAALWERWSTRGTADRVDGLPRPIRPLAVTAGVACFLVMAPLLAYASTHADDLLARSREVSLVGEPGERQAEEPTTLADSAQRVLFMLHLRGDAEPRHNIPGRPMLDLVSGLAFLVGLVAVAKARWPLALKTGLLALWLLPLVPSALTLAAPNALRAIGAPPAVLAIAAVGLDAVARWLERILPGRRGRVAAVGLLTVLLAAVTISNVRSYFVEWAAQPQLATEFSADIPRFVEYLSEVARDADVVICPYVFSSPNVHFLTLRQDPPFLPLDGVDALLAGATGRDRVFVCDEPAVNALLVRLYPDAQALGRYAIYTAHNGRIWRVPADRLWTTLPPAEEEQARYFIARLSEAFSEQSRAW